jgi:hypothetical protein
VLGFTVLKFAPQYGGPELPVAEIIAVAGTFGFFLAIVCFVFALRGGILPAPLPAPTEAHAANADEIAVDRKVSKKSVSTNASSVRSTSSVVIYHVPSNSMERVVVGGGDLEQALP